MGLTVSRRIGKKNSRPLGEKTDNFNRFSFKKMLSHVNVLPGYETERN